ncbi:30S ribosome-binding factor RbfA [candidate division WOR-3 bacterium]|nr:30S ribosome-binding factor RbfA [candidate division WOR-3 bacterium]
MRQSYRIKKIEETIAKEISKILDSYTRQRNLSMSTVTAVLTDPGIQNAKIKVSILGSKEEQEKTIEALNAGKKRLRYLLAQNIRIKYMPDIHFYLDRSREIIEKIESVMKEETDENSKQTK